MISWEKVKEPPIEDQLAPVILTDETMQERKNKVLCRMMEEGFDAIIVYADLEHGSNFEYLTGFLPRFEEALLILYVDGTACMLMGNENVDKAVQCRIKAEVLHMPHFSLPNQPMHTQKSVKEILGESKIGEAKSIGLVGWKNFTSQYDDNAALYDLPYYIVDALKKLCDKASFKNGAYMFIGENGARTTDNANELVHYEFGAAVAGNCILKAMKNIKTGISEMELASSLNDLGQTNNVVTIMAAGKRFEHANLYPTDKIIQLGDRISMTTGYKGGLQSRVGYAVRISEDLPKEEQDYLERIAKPYFNTIKTWLESIHVGMKGKELYRIVEEVFPKEQYGWNLNPGHLCGDEEWLSSPVYENSEELLKSGMLFQIDLIPSVKGYAGINCESGIALADEKLREEIKNKYPKTYRRIESRRKYVSEVLGIKLSEEILPTSSATGFCRPFFLEKEFGFKVYQEDTSKHSQ